MKAFVKHGLSFRLGTECRRESIFLLLRIDGWMGLLAALALTVWGVSAAEEGALVISEIGDQAILEDHATPDIPVVVGSDRFPVEDLLLHGTSSNPALVPDSNILFSGTNSVRQMKIIPIPNAFGQATITVVLSDPEGRTASQTFRLTVASVNDVPVVSEVPSQTIDRTAVVGPLPFTVRDIETPAADLVVLAHSSNEGLLPTANIQLAGSGENRTVTLEPVGTSGTAIVTLFAQDAVGLTGQTRFRFTILGNNSVPIAVPQSLSTLANTPLEIHLTGSDPDGDPLVFSVVDPPTKGELEGDPPDLIYTPDPAQTGIDQFTFRVNDGIADSEVATVQIALIQANQPPSISRIEDRTAPQDTTVGPIEFQVSDPETRPEELVVQATADNPELLPAGGIVLEGTGNERRLRLTPAAGKTGSVRVTVQVTDSEGLKRETTFQLTVTVTNRPPVALPLAVATVGQTPVTLVLRGEDPDGDPLTFALVSPPEKGALFGTAPFLVYVAKPGESGVDQFRFKVHDGSLESAPEVVSVAIVRSNAPPTISPVGDQMTEANLPLLPLPFLVDDEETPAAELSVTGTASNIALVNPDGIIIGGAGSLRTVTVVPAENQTGITTITLTVTDGHGLSTSTSFSLTVTQANQPPIADGQSLTTEEGKPIPIQLRGRDPDNDPVRYHIVENPTKGDLTGTPPNLTYTPRPNESGIDTFTFKLTDGRFESTPATVTVEILATNRPPTAQPQFLTLGEDQSAALTLSAVDPEGRPLTYTILEDPVKGSLSGTPPDLIYVARADETGEDRFTFKASDGELDSAPATVIITIVATNDPPVALDQFVSLDEDTSRTILLTGRDSEGDSLTYAVVTSPSKGSLSGAPPELTYVPNPNAIGPDSFTFRVNDGNSESAPATVTISINPINDPPQAADQFVSVRRNTEKEILLAGSDADGDALVFRILSSPAKGTILGSPPQVIYVPNADATGDDSFTFVANDGAADGTPGTVSIRIEVPGGPPTISEIPDQTIAPGQSTPPIRFEVADAETPPEELIVSARSSDTNLVSVDSIFMTGPGAQRTLVAVAAAGRTGETTITLEVRDRDGLSAATSFKLSVIQTNQAPLAVAQEVNATEDTPVEIELAGSDPEGAALAFSIDTQPEHGTLAGTAPKLTYRPDTNYFGEDQFRFRVSDGSLTSEPGLVSIVVAPVNDPPRIAPIPDQTAGEGGITNLLVSISDIDTPAEQLQVTAVSSNIVLVPAGGLILGGGGTNRTLSIRPAPGLGGSALIVVSVTDGESTARTEFNLEVVRPATPMTIRLAAPSPWTVFTLEAEVALQAEVSGDASNPTVSFYAGSALIGTDDSPPYTVAWQPEDPGFYVLTAQAIDSENRAAESEPVAVLVAAPQGRVAIVEPAATGTAPVMKEYLFDLAISSQIFTADQVDFETLFEDYDLVVWNAGAGVSLTPAWLDWLEQWVDGGKPVYFIGDWLVESAGSLSEAEQSRWSELIRLRREGTLPTGGVTVDLDQPHTILENGPSGVPSDFIYAFSGRPAGRRLDDELVLARSGGTDLAVGVEDSLVSGRRFTQQFRAILGESDPGREHAKRLFLNVVWWLLQRHCSLVDLGIAIEGPTESVNVGEPFRFLVRVGHTGECPASDVEVSVELPSELQVREVILAEGVWRQTPGRIVVDLGYFSSAEQKQFEVEVTASAPGEYVTRAFVRIPRQEVALDNNFTDPPATTVVEGTASGTKLRLEPATATEGRLILTGTRGERYLIETSPDLFTWTPLTEVVLEEGTAAEVPVRLPFEGDQLFFRAAVQAR